MSSVEFDAHEIEALKGSPEALRSLACWHDCQECMAAAIDPEIFAGCIKHHRERAAELEAIAQKIEDEL